MRTLTGNRPRIPIIAIMSLLTNKEKISTILFRIPHIQNLLIFKDALGNNEALVSILAELLKLRDPDILYIGYDNMHSPKKEVLSQLRDSAIVRVSFPDKNIICKDTKKTLGLAIHELQRFNNRIAVACDMLSRERNITAVAVSVNSA